jgi:hypothetical protein
MRLAGVSPPPHPKVGRASCPPAGGTPAPLWKFHPGGRDAHATDRNRYWGTPRTSDVFVTPQRRGFAGEEAGFTLLEAIVAIVVLVAALVPLYTLISGVSQSAFRLDEANRRAEFETDALNIMSTVNPMDKPAGAIDLGPYAVRWAAQPLLAPVDGSGYPSGISAFRIGLYNAKIDVVKPDGRVLVSFPLRMIGYQHVRDTRFR